MAIATIADLFVPVYSGRMVDAISVHGGPTREALYRACFAVAVMAALGGVLTAMRFVAFGALTGLTLKMMSRMATGAFWRVQRLSTDPVSQCSSTGEAPAPESPASTTARASYPSARSSRA